MASVSDRVKQIIDKYEISTPYRSVSLTSLNFAGRSDSTYCPKVFSPDRIRSLSNQTSCLLDASLLNSQPQQEFLYDCNTKNTKWRSRQGFGLLLKFKIQKRQSNRSVQISFTFCWIDFSAATKRLGIRNEKKTMRRVRNKTPRLPHLLLRATHAESTANRKRRKIWDLLTRRRSPLVKRRRNLIVYLSKLFVRRGAISTFIDREMKCSTSVKNTNVGSKHVNERYGNHCCNHRGKNYIRLNANSASHKLFKFDCLGYRLKAMFSYKKVSKLLLRHCHPCHTFYLK